MKMFMDRTRTCALAAAFLAAAALAMPCLAQEEKCDCPAKKAAVQGIPMLSQVPYFNRLFQVAQPCENDAARIGIDFEFCEGGEFPFAVKFWECGTGCEGGKCTAKAGCAAGECPAAAACECPAAKTACQSCPAAAKLIAACESKCACGEECACGSACAEAGKCACGEKCACAGKCACGNACQCGDHVVVHPFGPLPLVAHHFAAHPVPVGPVPFVAQHLGPHPGPAHPGGCPALFEHLLELTAKSAALEAKLEARAEQAELVSEMLELAQENARLKAQVELAEAKAEAAQQVLAVTLENEQLKSRLAELTSRLGEAEKEVLTAREAAVQPPRR
jgi:hypothetical protein